MKLKKRKKKSLEIFIHKKRKLKIKKRKKSILGVTVGYPLDMFLLGSKCCKEPGCPQPVYKRELDYCYYHNKVKEGLIDAEIY